MFTLERSPIFWDHTGKSTLLSRDQVSEDDGHLAPKSPLLQVDVLGGSSATWIAWFRHASPSYTHFTGEYLLKPWCPEQMQCWTQGLAEQRGQDGHPQWSEALLSLMCAKSHPSTHFIGEPCPTPFVLPVNESFYVHSHSYLWAIENISSWIMQIRNSKCTL